MDERRPRWEPELLMQLNEAGIKSAVASSSKNAREVVERTGPTDTSISLQTKQRYETRSSIVLVACEGIGCRPCERRREDAEAGSRSYQTSRHDSGGVGGRSG